MRLYLFDVSGRTFKIAVVAPAERFDAVLAETAPIIGSIRFVVASTRE